MYTYDARGNRLTMVSSVYVPNLDTIDYTYDDADQLVGVDRNSDEVSYKYNGDGLMTERSHTVGGITTTNRYYYDGANIVAEATVSGSTITFKARYVRGAQLVYREDATGKAYYLHNGHGDVTTLRQANGTLKNEYSYDIWGTPVSSTELVDNPFGYSGEYWDETTELQYLRARWYDPGLGRFISEDTWEGRINQTQNLNAYSYVLNNPLKYVDPTGQFADILFDIASAAYSTVEFVMEPSWKNAAYIGLDVASAIVPFVPSASAVLRTASKADEIVDAVKGTGKGLEGRGYKPQPGERTFEGYVKDNVRIDKETKLFTDSKSFNTNPKNDGQF